jgi:hypothetical protein
MGQTAPFAHVPIVPPEVLINTPLEVVTVTLIEVYVPAGTDMLTPTKAESVCKRVISYEVGVIGTVTAVPLEGVRVIPATGSVKLSIETPAGGRSKRVILRFALPPPQFVMHPPLFTPLQDAKRKTAADKVKTDNAFIFIPHPRSAFNCRAVVQLPVSM